MKAPALLLTATIAATALSSHARTEWRFDNTVFTVDTLFHATTGPGTTETELRVEGGGLVNNLFYATIDLSAPYLEIRAAKAGDAMRAVETVPDISDRFSKAGEEYFLGVNADFFNTGYPYNSLGAAITNGSLSNFTTPPAQADIDSYYISFDTGNVPSLARHVSPAAEGSVLFPDGSGYHIAVNRQRWENEMIVYTHQWQMNTTGTPAHTGTNRYGAEVLLRPADSPSTMWGEMQRLEVADAPVNGVGNMAIPAGCYVLSGHGTAIDYVMKLKKGDIVQAYMSISADGRSARVKELIAGFPFLLRDGMIQPTPDYPGHLANREPRTAVGYTADKSRLTLLVVDGRKAGGSDGVTQQMLANFMKCLGCSEAMNFDGGGSSTMYIRPLGVRNTPSTSSLDPDRHEGEPRVVVNALFAVSTAPVDNEVTAIEIRDKTVNLTTGMQYTPVVYGYNRYGVLVDTDVSDFTCDISPLIATADGTTITAAGDGSYRGSLTVRRGEASYSIPVSLNGGENHVSASVDEIEADPAGNVPAVYYTPLGVRTEHPAPGSIVIERRGPDARLIRL